MPRCGFFFFKKSKKAHEERKPQKTAFSYSPSKLELSLRRSAAPTPSFSTKTRKKPFAKGFNCLWRRKRESNPRRLSPLPVFETGPFGHLGISPCAFLLYKILFKKSSPKLKKCKKSSKALEMMNDPEYGKAEQSGETGKVRCPLLLISEIDLLLPLTHQIHYFLLNHFTS